MNEQVLDQVSGYLFESDPGKDLFKSLYNVKTYGSYTGKAKELIDLTISDIPKWAYQNTAFSYSMSTRLLPTFESYIEEDHQKQQEKNQPQNQLSKKQKQPKQPTQSPEDALKKAMQQTLVQMGITEDELSGGIEQDELLGEIQSQGEEIIWGLLATKNPDAECVSEQIKKADTGLKQVQKSLKNISAVSDSLLKGLEKIKTPYSEHGFDYGRDLTKIDASEFSYLHGDARQLFMLKFAKGELLQESSHEKKGLGDLIIAVDTSGSTCRLANSGMNVLDLEMGISLAMAKIAAKHKCRVRICLHHTRVHGDSGWLKGKDAINKYFANIYVNQKCVASGDNDFDVILGDLCEWMEERQYPSQRKPGIIFITDGHDTINRTTIDRVRSLKDNQGINLYSYFVVDNDPRNHAKDLVSISKKNYWIDSTQPIKDQIDAFVEVSL